MARLETASWRLSSSGIACAPLRLRPAAKAAIPRRRISTIKRFDIAPGICGMCISIVQISRGTSSGSIIPVIKKNYTTEDTEATARRNVLGRSVDTLQTLEHHQRHVVVGREDTGKGGDGSPDLFANRVCGTGGGAFGDRADALVA